MNKEATGFKYFTRNCTFEQLSSMRGYIKECKEMGVERVEEQEFVQSKPNWV